MASRFESRKFFKSFKFSIEKKKTMYVCGTVVENTAIKSMFKKIHC